MRVFDAIDTQQEVVLRPHRLRDMIEKRVELRRIEIADRASKEDEERRQILLDRRDALFVLAVETVEGELRKMLFDAVARDAETSEAHVDRREDAAAALRRLLA